MTGRVRIHLSSDLLSAELMRGLLEAEGIAAEIRGEGAGPYRVGQVQLWVAADDEPAARAIVAAVESGAYALDDDADVGSAPDGPIDQS